ncbi:MAG: adenine deaminase [Bacteroidota bacterium]
MNTKHLYSGNIVDIYHRKIFKGTIEVIGDKITDIREEETKSEEFYLPGFIDAHIHIESSMLVPFEFAKVALKHGTIATISDPHEIANVLGIDGVKYMIKNAKHAKLKFHFGAPSCVPATNFETAGAVIDVEGVNELLMLDDIYYLSEMMNYPGVLFDDKEVLQKIALAQKHHKPIDGHAPGLRGEQAQKYISAGISTDHECFTYEEALEKIQLGMKILIREGSAARNYEALHPLIGQYPKQLMFCCDDKHPDELLLFHIDEHVRRSIQLGYDLFDVLSIACLHPIQHYQMNVGTLKVGDKADFIAVNNLKEFKVLKTIINGEEVFDGSWVHLSEIIHETPNQFIQNKISADGFKIKAEYEFLHVINALDGQLITHSSREKANIVNGYLESDVSNDLLKIAVINRYQDAPISCAFIKNFGLKEGAIASSVAHDSHNIIVVGVDDQSMCDAVNLIIASRGGLSLVSSNNTQVIGLPVAGLMSDQDAVTIGKQYAEIDLAAKQLGSKLKAPYMLLSFMALLVIPTLKISDKGLFDGGSFQFASLQIQ